MIAITQKTAVRLLVGRTIAHVEVDEIHREDTNGGYAAAHHIHRIVFTDGSSITFNTVELIDGYAVTCNRHPNPKNRS